MTARDDRNRIEFLAPDERAFGESTNADFVGVDHDGWPDDDSHRRDRRTGSWPRRAAGAMVIGLLAAGVVAADPWDASQPNGAATTSTAPAPSEPALSTPAPSTADGATDGSGRSEPLVAATGDPLADVPVAPIGFVVDDLPSDDWVFTGNYSIPEAEMLTAWPFEIWADPGAARTSGRWLSIRALDETQLLFRDAARVTAGVRPAVLVTRSGVLIVRVDDTVLDRAYELEGFGLTREAMLELAAEIEVRSTGFDLGPAARHLDGMRLESAGERPPWSTAVLGNPGAVTNYFDTADELGIEVALRPATDGAEARLLLEPTALPDTFLLSGDPRQPVVVRPVAAGLVTVTGYRVDPATLTAIADSIRPATPEEWRSMIVRTNRGLDIPADDARDDDRGQRGQLADGTEWAGVQTPRFVYGGSPIGNWYGEVSTPNGALVQALANPHLTVLVATVTWPGTERTLRVSVGDAPPLDVPLEQLGDEPVFGAILPLPTLEPYTYELR